MGIIEAWRKRLFSDRTEGPSIGARTIKEVPGSKILIGDSECHMSRACFINRKELSDLMRYVETKRLIPQSPDDKAALKFWRDRFGLYVMINQGEYRVWRSEPSNRLPIIIWSNNNYTVDNSDLPKGIEMGIIGSAVLPSQLYEMASVNGLLVGNSVGNNKEEPWRVDILGGILKNMNYTLFGCDIDKALDDSSGAEYISLSGELLNKSLHGDVETSTIWRTYLAHADPVGIFTDLRGAK